MSRLVIIGAGGHGKVVADAAESSGLWSEICFLDDRFPADTRINGWEIVGHSRSFVEHSTADGDEFIVAIGDGRVRLGILDSLEERGLRIATVVHPSAIISKYATVGAGCVILAGVCVNASAIVGRGAILNTAATVDHDCRLADGVHICPGVHLAGAVTIGRGSWVGIGSCVKQGIGIGEDVTIGAGSAVVNDIGSNCVAYGVPARIRR